MTKKQLLIETITHFSGSSNRRCFNKRKCCYSPITTNQVGASDGCSLGRWMDPDNALELDNKGGSGIRKIMGDNELKSLLPEWMQNMDPEFLASIQDLHDDPAHWDSNGLTENGKKAVDRINLQFINE